MAEPATCVFNAEFDDPEQTAAALRGADVEYWSLAPVDYRGRLTVINLGDVVLQDVGDHAHVAQAQTWPDSVSFILPAAGSNVAARINGLGIDSFDAMLFTPGTEIHSVVTGSVDWFALSLKTDRFSDLLEHAGYLRKTGTFFALRDVLHGAPGLRRIVQDCSEVGRRDAARLSNPAVLAAITESVETQVALALGAFTSIGIEPRAERTRTRLVREAEEFLNAAMGRPIYTSEVSRALGVGSRTLTDAFNAVYGMSLQRALRVRRLNLARQRLRSHLGDHTLVKTVALDLGFWHMGRFSQAYRELFGETPSATLAAGPLRPASTETRFSAAA